MHTIDEALAAILGPIAPLDAERVPLAGRRRAGGRRGRRRAPSTCRRSTARRWTATRCAPPTPRPASRCGSRGGVAAGEVSARGAGRRHRGGDLHRRGDPAGRGRGPAVRAGRDRRRDRHARAARSSPAATCASAARTSTRATCSRAPASGSRLPRLSALASAGVGEVAVHRRPRLHLLVTGSELLAARRAARARPDPRVQRADGRAAGASRRARRSSTAAWSPTTALRRATAIERGLAGDVLVVSGGVSVGPHDHVKPAFEACGVEEVLWRVRIKPGKPMWFGRRGVDARVRPARQPALEHRLLLRVHRAGAAAAAAASATPPPGSCRAG